jgi:hypothetical protein
MSSRRESTGRRTVRGRLRQAYRFVRHELTAFTLLKPGNFHIAGHIMTMHQSGSHWLNNMLAEGLIREYQLPELHHIRDRSIINGPRHDKVYWRLPRIIQSHEAPSPLVHAWPLCRLVPFPKYVFLVRDIRAAMVSAYEKKRHLPAFQIPFSAYLRNDRLIGNDIPRDLWLRMRQLNAWDRDIRRLPPERTLVVYYERMKADTAGELRRVWSFLDLPGHDEAFFAEIVAATSKERMAAKESSEGAKIVRTSERDALEWYSAEDRAYFTATVDAWLRNHFGYDYHDWSRPGEQRAAA